MLSRWSFFEGSGIDPPVCRPRSSPVTNHNIYPSGDWVTSWVTSCVQTIEVTFIESLVIIFDAFSPTLASGGCGRRSLLRRNKSGPAQLGRTYSQPQTRFLAEENERGGHCGHFTTTHVLSILHACGSYGKITHPMPPVLKCTEITNERKSKKTPQRH